MPPRLSLSSIICPSAPFLLPISTRIALRASTQRIQPWTISSTNATTFGSKSKSTQTSSRFLKRKKQDVVSHRPLNYDFEPLQLFRRNISAGNYTKAMELLPGLAASSLLVPHDTLLITQLLHNKARQHPRDAVKTEIPKYIPHIRKIVDDIKTGSIPPHHAAIVHLISFLKVAGYWQEGIDFWTWCRAQDDAYVNQAVYGAAIELLTYHGSHSLEELEELYQEGLSRFPGTFAGYHMSPEAIVADRTQPTTIARLPMTLLQGILSARLVHGDWKNAYLALDVAFRLYPTQVPPRIFEIFLYERPLSESFPVTMMAVRSGVVLRPGHLNTLLQRLIGANRYYSTKEQIATIHGIIIAMQASVGSGGFLEALHLSSLIKAFEILLPDHPSNADDTQDAELRQCVVSTLQRIIKDFRDAGIPTRHSVYCTFITILGKARLPDVIASTVGEMVAGVIQANEITYRVLLSALGEAGESQGVETSWETLVESAEAEGRPVSEGDWITLAKATKSTGNFPFLESQLEALSHTLTEDIKLAIDRELEKEPVLLERKGPPMVAAAMAVEMDSIRSRVHQLLELFKSGSLLDFNLSPTPLFLDPVRPAIGSREDLRAIYDELTTDPLQPPPPEDPSKPKPLSPTGFALDELRFQNWVTILEVMADAEVFEVEKGKQIDEAIASGEPLPARYHLPLYRTYLQPKDGVVFTSREELRQRVLQLRNVQASQVA